MKTTFNGAPPSQITATRQILGYPGALSASASVPSSQITTTRQILVDRYGTLMTLAHLAQELHRSPEGLRISLRSGAGWATQINAARKKLGRRVYFDTARIAALLDGATPDGGADARAD